MISSAHLPVRPSSLTRVETPHRAGGSIEGAASGDVVTLGPPPPSALPAPPTPVEPGEEGRPAHRLRPLAAVVVAGLVGATVGAALAPAVSGWLVPPTSQSQTSEPAGEARYPTGLIDPGPGPQDGGGHYPGGIVIPDQQDGTPSPGRPDTVPQPVEPGPTTPGDRSESPTAVLWMASMLAETSAEQLPQALQAPEGWAGDLASLQSTARQLLRETDAVLRDFKGSSPERRAAVQGLLEQLGHQAGALEQRLGAEAPAADAFLLEQRNSLNQLGIFSFNLQQQIGDARSQAAPFSSERHVLSVLEDKLSDATTDLAMATEKTTESRVLAQALVDNVQAVKQLLGQVGTLQASVTSSPTRQQVEQVDTLARLLDQGAGQLQRLLEQEGRDVREASGRAHEASRSLMEASQLLQGGAAEGAALAPGQGR